MVSLPKSIEDKIGTIIVDTTEEKFTKDQTFYVDKTKFGLVPCKDCNYFLENEEDPSKSKCEKVSESGGSNYIMAGGTCTIWNGTTARIKIIAKIHGRGEKKGILPGKIREKILSQAREILYPTM